MTLTQTPDRMLINEKEFFTQVFPLEHSALARKIHPTVISSDLWRGYVGTWRIVKGGLYLIHIEIEKEQGNQVKILTGIEGALLADWFTGALNAVDVIKTDFCRVGEYEPSESLSLVVKRGVVQSMSIATLPPPVSQTTRASRDGLIELSPLGTITSWPV